MRLKVNVSSSSTGNKSNQIPPLLNVSEMDIPFGRIIEIISDTWNTRSITQGHSLIIWLSKPIFLSPFSVCSAADSQVIGYHMIFLLTPTQYSKSRQ